jgi:hypothetical protein
MDEVNDSKWEGKLRVLPCGEQRKEHWFLLPRVLEWVNILLEVAMLQ